MLEEGQSPEDMINTLLDVFEPEILEKHELAFKCNCSSSRMAKALISIGEKELQAMIDDGEPVELKCQFCGSTYTFSVDELKEMLEVAR